MGDKAGPTNPAPHAPARASQSPADAAEFLRAAQASAYRFPEGFPGFAADLAFAHDAVLATGTVRVRSPREVSLDIALDETDAAWLRQELAAMVAHRWPLPAETSGPVPRLASDDGHPLGRLLEIGAGPSATSYRVREGTIVQVVRPLGDSRIAVTTQEHLTTGDGRVLPTEYTVVAWDLAQSRLTRADTFSDRYTVVANVYLPAARRVVTAEDAGVTARQFTLSRHHLID